MQDLRGKTLGRYRLITELGSGGMGTVYYAEHVGIGRRAAIKVLDPVLAADSSLVERFFTEARAVNALRHPHIVDVEDLSHEGDLYYLVMELLEGETLGARLERMKRLSLEQLLAIVRPVASALSAAHQRGMVHRDLKPENIFIARDAMGKECVKLLDFGIVKLTDGAADGAATGTQAGMLLGTPAYMSPEQCAGLVALDARSDIYSLGVLSYEALGGRLPFVRNNLLGLLSAHQCDTPLPLLRIEGTISEGVSQVVMRALSKVPEERQKTAIAFADALEQAAKPEAAPVATQIVEKRKVQTKNVGGKLSEIIGDRIQKGTLVIPSMPEACMHCMELLRKPRVRMSEVAERVRRDPLLSTRVLTVASSSAQGSRERIVDVETALVRLGTQATQTVIIDMAARQVFVSRDPSLRARLRTIWERSVAISVAAGGIIDVIGGPIGRGTAQTGGLVAEVGHPILAALLLDVERAAGNASSEGSWVTDEVFAGVVAEHGAAVGARVADEWNLDPELVATITDREQWDRERRGAALKNVVRLAADLAAMAGYCAPGQISPDLSAVEEGRKLVGLDPDDEERLVHGLPKLVVAQIGGQAPKRAVTPTVSSTKMQRRTA